MKGLTIHQPFASLIAMGAKRVETRDWAAPANLIGERIVIHAGKNPGDLDLCQLEPFSQFVSDPEQLPLGAIVATAVLDRCRMITPATAAALLLVNPVEHAFGNYATPPDAKQRYAFVLRDVLVLPEPIPFRGLQKFFHVTDDVLAAVVGDG